MRRALLEGAELRRRAAEALPPTLAAVAGELARLLAAGGTVYFFGNGGSAAQAQHFAAELTGRYQLERRPLAAVALGTGAAEVTAIANDYGYEEVFARPLAALVRPGDAAVGLSGSGGSSNVARALEVGAAAGAYTVAFTGSTRGESGGPVGEAAQVALVAPGETIADVQELHLALGHLLCELVEKLLAERQE